MCARQKIFFLMGHGKSSQKASLWFIKECNVQDQTCQLSLISAETCSFSRSFLQHTISFQQGENFVVWFSETSHSFNCHHMRIPVLWAKVTGRCCLWGLSALWAVLTGKVFNRKESIYLYRPYPISKNSSWVQNHHPEKNQVNKYLHLVKDNNTHAMI